MTVTGNYERRSLELRMLTEVAQTLTVLDDLPSILTAVMENLFNILEPADTGMIMLWDEGSGLFRVGASFGCDVDKIQKVGLRAGESITGKVFDLGVATLFPSQQDVADAMADMRKANREACVEALNTDELPVSALAAPLRVGDHKYGVLVLETLKGPTRFHQGDLPYVQALADNIALAIDRDRLESEAESVLENRKVDRLRAEVMAVLSHELRTPLTAIKGYSTALLMEEIDWEEEKRREFLQFIDIECDNLQGMIGEILDSSLIDVGQMVIEYQPERIERLAKDVAREMQRRTEKHQIIVDFPADFPIIDVDLGRIKQVIRNIVDNSIKYSPEGGLIVIRGEIRLEDVVVSISDQGVGISPEDLIPLFEKYFRVKSPTGHHVAGTGLGLPVARGIIEAHKGRIWAESKVGQGTTLSFSLPKESASNEKTLESIKKEEGISTD
jgi:K+-sensing histidine kinase KdpD